MLSYSLYSIFFVLSEKKKRRAGMKMGEVIIAPRHIRGVRILDENETIDNAVVPIVRPLAEPSTSNVGPSPKKKPRTRMSTESSVGIEESVNQLPAIPPGFGDVNLKHSCEECFGRFATKGELRTHGKEAHRFIPQKM